ncbi:MAG: class I SAM-dependent methyltransferase [Pirellulaceae bacterium]
MESQREPRGQRLYPRRDTRLYWHLTCIRRVLEAVIAKYVEGKSYQTLLDFGCGNMPYRPLFEPHVAEYIGCDLPGNKLAAIQISDRDGLTVEDGQADIVLSSQVLEHVADPAAYLAECHRVLNPAGLLVLSTHGAWKYHPDPADYWRWTSAGLQKTITENGFRILQVEGVMGPAATALQLWQDAVLPTLPRLPRPWFIRWMQWRIQRADEKCSEESRNRDACVYMVVARPRKASNR